MSLLTMVKSTARRLGVSTALTAVCQSTDPNVLLLLELAQEEGRDLAARHSWSALQSEATFVTVAAAVQPSSIPDDFGRFIDETMNNRTTRRPVDGPISPQEWQDLQAGAVSRVDPAFRVRGTTILLTPTPVAGQTIAYEYISRCWCIQGLTAISTTSGTSGFGFSSGALQDSWQADSDVGRLDETLMSLGLEWRFRARKGFDHEIALRTYERQVSDAIFRDGGRRTVSTSPACDPDLSDARARTWPGQVVP